MPGCRTQVQKCAARSLFPRTFGRQVDFGRLLCPSNRTDIAEGAATVAEKERTTVSVPEAFEVADPIHKFMVIEGPQPVAVQFFRHYGHPRRNHNSLWVGDRVREVVCMAMLCCLFLYFPLGLLLIQWSEEASPLRSRNGPPV